MGPTYFKLWVMETQKRNSPLMSYQRHTTQTSSLKAIKVKKAITCVYRP